MQVRRLAAAVLVAALSRPATSLATRPHATLSCSCNARSRPAPSQPRTKGQHGAQRPDGAIGGQEIDGKALPELGRAEAERHHRPAAGLAAGGQPQAQPAPAEAGRQDRGMQLAQRESMLQLAVGL